MTRPDAPRPVRPDEGPAHVDSEPAFRDHLEATAGPAAAADYDARRAGRSESTSEGPLGPEEYREWPGVRDAERVRYPRLSDPRPGEDEYRPSAWETDEGPAAESATGAGRSRIHIPYSRSRGGADTSEPVTPEVTEPGETPGGSAEGETPDRPTVRERLGAAVMLGMAGSAARKYARAARFDRHYRDYKENPTVKNLTRALGSFVVLAATTYAVTAMVSRTTGAFHVDLPGFAHDHHDVNTASVAGGPSHGNHVDAPVTSHPQTSHPETSTPATPDNGGTPGNPNGNPTTGGSAAPEHPHTAPHHPSAPAPSGKPEAPHTHETPAGGHDKVEGKVPFDPNHLPKGVHLTAEQQEFLKAPAGHGALGHYGEVHHDDYGATGTIYRLGVTDAAHLGFGHLPEGVRDDVMHHYLQLNHLTEAQARHLPPDFVAVRPSNGQLAAWIEQSAAHHGHILTPDPNSAAGKLFADIQHQTGIPFPAAGHPAGAHAPETGTVTTDANAAANDTNASAANLGGGGSGSGSSGHAAADANTPLGHSGSNANGSHAAGAGQHFPGDNAKAFPSTSPESGGTSSAATAGIVVGGVATLAAMAATPRIYRSYRDKRNGIGEGDDDDELYDEYEEGGEGHEPEVILEPESTTREPNPDDIEDAVLEPEGVAAPGSRRPGEPPRTRTTPPVDPTDD